MAGDTASRLYANAEAEAHYRTGLEAARRIGASSSLLRSMYERRGSALELIGRYDDAIANYQEMHAEAVAREDDAMELAANSTMALLYSTATPKFDPPLGRRLSEENVLMARRIGDRSAEARALWNIVVANVYGGGDAARAVEAGEASLAIARELDEREQLAFTLNDVCRAYMAKGDFSTAAQRLAEARRLWEELDNRPMLGENLTVGSSMHMFHGDFAAALADARQAAEISASIGNAWGESHALLTVYRVEVELGQLGAAIDTVQRSMELGERGGFAYAGIATRADLARVIAYLGDGERALALADEALAIALERVPPAVSLAHVSRADALIALGRLHEAHVPLDEVDLGMLPEPDRTFLMGASRTIRSRLALAEGDVEGAEAIARGLVEDLRGERGGRSQCGSAGGPRAGAPRCPPVRGGRRRSRSGDRAGGAARGAPGALGGAGVVRGCARSARRADGRRPISVAGRARSSKGSRPGCRRRTFGDDSSRARTSALWKEADMTEPIVDRPEFPREYGNPTQRLDWAEVERKLESASAYWIASTRPDGRPHVVPRDGTWLDGGLYYGGSPETVHARNSRPTRPSRCTSETARRRSSSRVRSSSRSRPRRWPSDCPMRRSPSTRSTGGWTRASTREACRCCGRAACSPGRASRRTPRASGSRRLGGPPGTRTPNLRIKSPLLCQIELEARRSVATGARERASRHVCWAVEMGIPPAMER